MKPVFIIAIVAISMIGVMVPSAFAETWYYYVEPLPEYASYANNVMKLSTDAWEEANNDLQFIEVGTWEQADFRVSWVKEFGGEHVGYAFGSWYIEVGLGDSNCSSGMWQPYSETYTTNIMTHEIGHVLGFEHVNDPNSIMYPTAINWEYGNVETSETLTTGYGYFQPICTSKDVTTFDWHVSSDDPTYGFDVYFVPSINEFDNWVDGESFNYFDDDGCFGENMLSVGGTCEGVTQDSGLLVIMGDDASEPLTEITLNLQENNFMSVIDSSESNKPTSNPSSNEVILVDNTFALHVDSQQEYSIKYPSNWTVDPEGGYFSDDYYWTARLFVVDYVDDVDYTGLSESKILEDIIWFEENYCDTSTYENGGYICYDFQLEYQESLNKESYFVYYTVTRQYDSDPGVEYFTYVILREIHDGPNTWLVYAEIDENAFESYNAVMVESLLSFQLIQSGENSSTTNSIPIPIPTPQPDVITSTGTAALSKTSVNVSLVQSEQVKIYGIVSNVDKSTRVNITYTYPDGTTDGGTIFTTDTGVYETYLNLDGNSPIGNYEILVTAKGKILGTLILQVNDKILDSHPFVESIPLPTSNTSLNTNGIASFVDQTKDPQHYIDRYNNEPTYKEWFDENYSQYSSIYEAVGLEEPVIEPTPEPITESISEPETTTLVDTSSSDLFPDPDKDPREYLIRYYTEPKYQEWFDTNFPNESIEDKVGYPNKIITNDYYVSHFGFVVEPPKNWIVEQNALSIADGDGNVSAGLVVFYHPRSEAFDWDCNTNYDGGIIIWYGDDKLESNWTDYGWKTWNNVDRNVDGGLLQWFSETMIYDEQTNLKITDRSITKLSSENYIVKYYFTDVNILPAKTDRESGEEECGELYITLKNSITHITEPGGGYYTIIHASEPQFYDEDVSEVNKMIETFYLGDTELLSNIMLQQSTSFTEPTPEPVVEPTPEPVVEKMVNCGTGTELVNGICEIIKTEEKSSKGGGCLIATATYGSEMATEVQQLRELRDNQLLQTESGTAFMGTFNDVYYSFSPTIADMERENPYFKEAVKLAITPMISTLSLMENANSESEVLSIGISVIALNLGMYLGVPAIVIVGIRKKFI